MLTDDPTKSELIRVDQQTGELLPYDPPPATIDSIVRQETGNLSNEILTSYPVETEEGQMRLDKHQSFQSSPNDTTDWLNRAFSLVAFTAKPVLVKKGADGVRLEDPRLAVRTVMETSDGSLIASSSAWLYQSLKDILRPHGQLSAERPVSVVLKKAGNAYRLFRVWPVGHIPANALPDKPKSSKKS